MKNLETLINELCPEGVEFVKLVKYATVQYGYPFDSKLFSEDEKFIPLIRIRDVLPAKPSTYYSGEYLKEYIVTKGDMLVGMDGNFNMEKWNNRDGLLNQRVCKIYTKDETILLDGFLYHYLRPLFKKIENSIQGSTVKHLSAKVINKIEIPLPPIEVQTEIVRILDRFTSLEAELEAELDCRKRQYEYYREKLLSFDNVGGQEVEWKKMSEVGTFIRGNGLQKKDFTEEGVGCIHYGQIYTRLSTFTDKTLTCCSEELAKKLTPVHPGDLIIACTSENVEDVCKSVAWLGKEDIVTGGHACVFSHHENPKYIAYLMQTENFFQQKKKYARGVKVIDIKISDLEKIKLPIPSLEEQQRIVSILDRFESLTTSLQSGLPAEISARRQQYEYYRDKLLTFKRKAS